MTEIVCLTNTNPMGILQGGRLVQWMDMALGIQFKLKLLSLAVINYLCYIKSIL